MYYINPNKRVLLYYPIPCISIQIIIKFCAFVTSILRKKESSLLVEASPAANYMQIIAHIHTISLILHLHSSSIWGWFVSSCIRSPSPNCLRSFPKNYAESLLGDIFLFTELLLTMPETDFHAVQGLSSFQIFSFFFIFLEKLHADKTLPPTTEPSRCASTRTRVTSVDLNKFDVEVSQGKLPCPLLYPSLVPRPSLMMKFQ